MLRSGAVLLLNVCFLSASTLSYAGQITATASQDFCQVTVVTCNFQDVDRCPVVFSGPLRAGQSLSSETGHFCYKRENNPPHCDSGKQQSWQCHTNSIDQPDTLFY